MSKQRESGDVADLIRETLEIREQERGEGQRPSRQKKPQRPKAERGKPPDREGSYRFLNPYNFVRHLPQPPATAVQKSAETRLLARCEPPPHDRYLGLTGRITCTVEAVTPLFVSDSHKIQLDEEHEDHKHYRFFQYGGQVAIPATSLRGAIRSVFEAVANSCFAVFDGERRLEFREQPEYGNKVKSNAGIVRRLAQLATDDRPGVDGEIELCQIGKVGAYYESREMWKNVLGQKPSGGSWQCGNRVVARAKPRRRDWLVREIAETREELGPLQINEEYTEGWLKITGRGEDTNKRSETLFLDPAIHGSKGSVAFSCEVQQEYNSVLANQIKQGDLPVDVRSNTLNVGDLVWVDVNRQRGQSRASHIVRVQVPRMPYRQTIGQLLPPHLLHCVSYDALCPACRVFGWVHEKPSDDMERTAYAGRIRLTNATAVRETIHKYEEITLAILSSPKPTTTQFYLLDRNGQPNAMVTYDTQGACLRGRKLYRHFGSREEMTPEQWAKFEQEYKQAVNPGESGRTDQNRTVCDVLKPGAQFTFMVEFENLAPVELGALLWTLELEGKGHHRLGFAKPLGFGSVKIEVTALGLMEPGDRYESLGAAGGWRDGLPHKDGWVQAFREAMQALYDRPFAQLSNVRDLLAMLGQPPDLPIHYPRPPRPPDHKPDPEGKNFEWFVGNKRKGGPKLALKLADEDMEGLPLLNKRGEPFGE